MKTLACQKAIAFSLLLILLFSLSIETAYSAEKEVVRVDQVYADLPEMQVYFHLLDKNGEVVTRTVSESNVLLQYNSERAEVNSVQNAAASKTQVYFLLDISDSMPTALFESIKAELLQLYQTHSQNEKYTLITFGKEVVVQLDGDESAETIESTIKSLQNTDTRTVLYDAVSKVGELAAERSDYTRRMIYLFTDGEDWTVGGHTQNETQNLIRQSGIPVYAFGVSSAQKKYLDALSELARVSGGKFTSVSKNTVAGTMAQTRAYADAGYVVSVTLKSNVVGAQNSAVALQVGDASDSRTVSIKNWQADNTAPVIVEVQAEGSSLHIIFSESTLGGSSATDYIITSGSQKRTVDSVARVSDKEVELRLSAPLYDGEYVLTANNVTDTAVEKNALTESYPFTVTGVPYTVAAFFSDNILWIAAGALLFAAVIIFVVARKQRKRMPATSVCAAEAEVIEAEKASEKYHIHAAEGKLVHLSISGRNLARRDIELHVEGTILLGRSSSCDVRIDDEQISRRNTELICRNGRLFANNISQTNGTMLNGLMISGERELHSGDTIVLGDTRITITF